MFLTALSMPSPICSFLPCVGKRLDRLKLISLLIHLCNASLSLLLGPFKKAITLTLLGKIPALKTTATNIQAQPTQIDVDGTQNP